MLELIFQGFWEWLYSLVLECWEYFSSSLLDIMSMDFSYLKTHIPIIMTIEQSMLAIGWALLIGNLIFQAVRSMLSGLGFEGEDPKLLFTRSFVFTFLLLASPQICELCLNMTSVMIGILELPDAVNITLADNASFAGLACAWLLVIICGIIVMFQSFKLIVEMAERYFILAVLTISAPLAFGMGGSRNTSDIFTGWCRMYGSMCLLMVLNVAFIKMLLSVLSFYPSGLDVLPWMILVLTVVKVAKKADVIVTRIGLNPAITGDSLGRTFPGALTYLVVRSAASKVTKAIGRNMGGQSRGASGNPTQNGKGSPKTVAPISGIGHTGTATSQNARTTQQTAARSAETTSGDCTQVNQGGAVIGGSQQTKKTAVPTGMRRSLTHSSTARAVAANAAAMGIPAQNAAANGLHTGTAGMRTGGGVIGKSAMPRSGTAGMASNTQTHRQSQTVRQGAALSKLQTGEKNNLTVTASKTPEGALNGTATPSVPKENRFTRRPAASAQQAALAPTATKSAVPQLGSAEKSPSAAASDRETRHSRNPMPTMTGHGQTAPSPARQESRQVPQAPKGNAVAQTLRHGTAETAPAKQTEMRTRQTAKKPAQNASAVSHKTVLGAKTMPKQMERKSSVKRRGGNGK